MYYLYLKSLHIIFVVCWFAGLFYSVRLLVYYAEAQEKPPEEKRILSRQYQIMLQRLWSIIAFPSAVLATVFGVGMLMLHPALLRMPWMHIKLGFVGLLWLYHGVCHRYVNQVKGQALQKSGRFFRLWNEGATLILFSVVFLAVLKNALNWFLGLIALLVLAIVLWSGIKLYKTIRKG